MSNQLTGSEELSISDDFDSIAYLANGKSYTVGQYFGPNPECKAAILAWHTKHLAKARLEAKVELLVKFNENGYLTAAGQTRAETLIQELSEAKDE